MCSKLFGFSTSSFCCMLIDPPMCDARDRLSQCSAFSLVRSSTGHRTRSVRKFGSQVAQRECQKLWENEIKFGNSEQVCFSPLVFVRDLLLRDLLAFHVWKLNEIFERLDVCSRPWRLPRLRFAWKNHEKHFVIEGLKILWISRISTLSTFGRRSARECITFSLPHTFTVLHLPLQCLQVEQCEQLL